MLRALIVAHRWLGVAACLLMAAWFFSGVVMMYVGYPNLEPQERYARLPELDAAAVRVAPAKALTAAALEPPTRVRLSTVLGRPAYHFLADGRWSTVFADDGAPLGAVSEADALRAAALFMPGARPEIVALVELDQWSLSASLHPYRPLWRVRMNDAAGSELYVSARTAEVVRDTARAERGWNWVGSVTHWIYLVPLRRVGLWADTVMWIALVATVMTVLGIVVGLARWRWQGRHRSGSRSPYRGWMRWHHLLGLAFALVTFTWIFSGWMSMNPWKIFPPRSPDAAELERYRGGALAPERYALAPAQALGGAGGVREIEWSRVGGAPYYVLRRDWNESLLVDARSGGRLTLLPREVLVAAAERAMGRPAAAATWLERYDAYYYAHHHARRVPMLRVVFDDEAATWLHIDPASGEIVARLARANRIQRWLFNGLHSFDILFLLERRWLWEGLLVLLSSGGFALSVTGIVIAWRRLRRPRSAEASLAPAKRSRWGLGKLGP